MTIGLGLGLSFSRSRSAPFTVDSIFANSEQGAWYDPSDLTTLYQDAAGTTPVTADGDPVGYMGDKSGNGNHALQTVSAARPVYKTDGTYHWLAPDMVDDRMTVGAAGDFNFLHDGTGCEWFFAAQPASVANLDSLSFLWITGTASTSDVGANVGVDDRSSSSTNNAFRFIVQRGVQFSTTFDEYESDTIPSLTNAYVFGGGHATSRTPNYFANRDATEVYSGNYDNAPSTANSTNPLTLFARASNDFHFGGKFYGGLFIDRLLTSSERSDTRQYFADKSGVTL